MRKRVDPGGVHRESDGFWSKVLVLTIVVIWVALVAGQWVAHWAIENGKFSKGHVASTSHAIESNERPEYNQPPHVDATETPTVTDSPSAKPSAMPIVRQTVVVGASPEAAPSESPSDAPANSEIQTPVLPPTDTPSATASASPADTGPKQYALQLGVFSSTDNAQKMADELRDGGYSVEVVPMQSGSDVNYVVRLGHFASKAEAVAEQGKLQGQGYHPIPVAR